MEGSVPRIPATGDRWSEDEGQGAERRRVAAPAPEPRVPDAVRLRRELAEATAQNARLADTLRDARQRIEDLRDEVRRLRAEVERLVEAAQAIYDDIGDGECTKELKAALAALKGE